MVRDCWAAAELLCEGTAGCKQLKHAGVAQQEVLSNSGSRATADGNTMASKVKVPMDLGDLQGIPLQGLTPKEDAVVHFRSKSSPRSESVSIDPEVP